MGRSLKVSEEGLKRVKEAFNLTGWTQDHLAGRADCTRPTVNKFLAGGDVEKRIFEAICRELKLRVAEIADLESEEGQLNTSVSVNGNREQSLATLTQKSTEADEEKVSFSILGTASKVDLPKLKAIVAHLQKITGDTSIEIVDIEEGSIRLILEGSQESLEQIEALFKSGQLTEVEGIPVEDVQFVTPKIPEHEEDIQVIDKKRLAFILAGSASSEEIQELKAAFTEILDKDEEKEAGNKARLVQEIITTRAKRRNLIDADLRGADLSFGMLSHADLRGANLSDAKLSRAHLTGANLSNAILSDTNLSGADLTRTDLSGAKLSGAKLSGADLSGADLSGADLSHADLRGADLSGADLSRASLRGVRIDAQTKIDSKWRLVWEIVNQGAEGRDLIGIDLRGANLRGANLSGANLSGANLSGANLSDANLSDANLSRAGLSGAGLRGANLSRANLRGTDMTGSNLSHSELTGANLSGANLREVGLSGANLRGANLRDTDLNNANLSSANLNRANRVVADQSGADLSGADRVVADLSGADRVVADLSGADLRGTNLKGANLSDAVVENAQFGANLGLTEEMKLDLQRRGAIFEDSPGDRSGVLSRR